ncbi:MAG TPA: adenylate/guanylate cyclase domain-containing protein [Candidatus Dormibacteraeota bacterium]
MTCANCGGDNESGRRFCGDCGAPLAVACPACGAANPARARFCGDCGALLAAAAPEPGAAASSPAATPAALTERRHVSVLFADLVGFTTLSERRDSEEVRELLTRYFDACQTVVGRYGGVVEKFIGDAVMAVWGTPVAKEDDAERAVRAALEVVEAVTQLGGETGAPELRARAGVLSGEATVNLGATGQGMVAGDLVNTASRIQSAAEPATVLVGESTKRATDAAISYRDAGMHTLKGKAEPVHLWHATRVVAGIGGLMKSEGLEPPFVGRDRELKLVKDLFLASADDGRAHLVQVTGIAGIGKSRLSWEFFKYMDGLKRLFRWHRGRCLAYGEGVTYWALAEMVRGRAGITEGEDRVSAMNKLREAVEQGVPDPTDRKFVEPRLAHLLGLEERSASDKSDLFAGWRLFFERLAAADPVIMVFEDLQWADPSLLEFIDYLLDWSRAFPIFVMTLARPGHETGLGPKRNATSISLDPLPPRAMQLLLTGLVPGLPAELTAKILDRAEGVPLYAVETVRMLLDRKLLVQEGPVYRPTGPVEDLEVPETLHALIAARLDGLTAPERRLVQEASVLGKTCTPAALAAVSGLPEREIEPVLATLVAKEVLTVQADPRSPERGQYGFVQDLVRTVAYETLPKKDRKAMHLSVASFLQLAWGAEEGEVVEVVASHFLEAHRLAPDAEDAPQIRDLARRMLIRAGERAASLAAPAEARAYFERAAEITELPTERAGLLELAGAMAFQLGQMDNAAGLLTAAMRLFEESGQLHPAARAEARLAEVAFQQGHLDQAIESVRHAHEVLAGEEPDAAFALVTGQFGRFLALSGNPEAGPVLEEALRLAEQLELHEVYSQALSSRAVAIMREGRHDETVTLLRRALEVALEGDYATAAFRAWNNLAVTLEGDDRYLEVVELIATTLEMARRKGDRSSELAALLGYCAPLVALGRWDEAIAFAAEAETAEELEAMGWAAVRVGELVSVHVRRGETEAARQVFAVAKTRSDEHNIEIRARVGCIEVELLSAEDRHAEAVSLAKQLLEMVPLLGLPDIGMKRSIAYGVTAALDLRDLASAESMLEMVRTASPGLVTPSLRAHAARLGSRVCAQRGQNDSVEAGFTAAIAEFRDIAMPFELGVTLLELAEWLDGQDRHEDATAFGLESLALFERLQARPWLDRAQLLLDGGSSMPYAAQNADAGGETISATGNS